MENQAIEEAAKTIWSTWHANQRIDALPISCRPTTRAEGYRVQAQVARLSKQKTFGWKIAATSKAGQKHIGVDGPLAGRLLEKRAFPSGAKVSLTNNIMNVIEAEFATQNSVFPGRSCCGGRQPAPGDRNPGFAL